MKRRNFLKLLGALAGTSVLASESFENTKDFVNEIKAEESKWTEIRADDVVRYTNTYDKPIEIKGNNHNCRVFQNGVGEYSVVFDKPLNDSNYHVTLNDYAYVSNMTKNELILHGNAKGITIRDKHKVHAWANFNGVN